MIDGYGQAGRPGTARVPAADEAWRGPSAPSRGVGGVRGAVTDRTRRLALARGLILLAAFISFVLSVSLWFAGSHDEGLFVGIWVPTIVSLGAFLLPRRVES